MRTDSDAQALVDGATARILIAVADSYGRLRYYSERHSSKAIEGKPEGWKKSAKVSVNDVFPDLNTSVRFGRVFSKGRVDALALPHEWGVELLIGVVAGVGSTAITALAKWIWRKWERQKEKRPEELSVIRFQVMDNHGKKQKIRTVEMSGHLTEVQVSQILKEGFQLMREQTT